MTDLRRYAIVFLTIGIAFSWTTGALAVKSFLRYDNGTVVETWSEIKDDVETPSADAVPIVTLDVQEEIHNVDYEPISKVSPGQEVILWCFFNHLDSVGVPFDQLIGHEIVFNYILIGALNFRDSLIPPIEDGDQGWSGTGIHYIVPDDAPAGKFLYLTTMRIKGFRNKNRLDWGIYNVVK